MALKLRIVVVVTGLLALAGAGCSQNQTTLTNAGSGSLSSATAPTPASASVPTSTADPACGGVPAPLVGKWTKTLRPEDLPPELFDADTGVFVMTLGPGHHVRTDVDNDHPGDDEDICWTADRFVYVTHRKDCSADSLGVYAWVLRDDVLAVTAVKDGCFWRPFLTTFKTWARVTE
jgi:hypothetical protein